MSMNAKTFVEEFASTEEGRKALNQESAILELTELICRIMQETGVGRAELARRLGKTKGYVTQLLDGRANMTLRTIADVFTALGRTVHFHDGSEGHDSGHTERMQMSDPRGGEVVRWPIVKAAESAPDTTAARVDMP